MDEPEGLNMDVPTTMSLDEFIQACIEYNKEHPNDLSDLECCPVHKFATTISKACYTTVPGIKTCPLCGKPMCPVCGRHNVSQLSRVTGYVGEVSGWNEAKKQELIDRQRYKIQGRML